MKKDRIIKIAGIFSKVFVTVLIMLLIIHMLQFMTMEIYRVFTYNKMYQSVSQKQDLSPEKQRLERIKRSAKHLTTDNKILLVYSLRDSAIQNASDVNIYDTDQNLLWQGERDDIPYSILSWSSPNRAVDQRWIRQLNRITPELSQSLEIAVRAPGPIGEIMSIWRYDFSDQSFTIFSANGGKVGFVGANGLVTSKKELRPFGDVKNLNAWCPRNSINPKLLWITEYKIYEIDLEAQQVEIIFESSDTIVDIQIHRWFYDIEMARNEIGKRDIKYRPLLYCGTDQDNHYLILKDPAHVIKVDLPAKDWSTYFANSYRFVSTEDSVFLKREWFHEKDHHLSGNDEIEWFRELRKKDNNRSVEFYKVADDGKIESLNSFTWVMPARTSTAANFSYFTTFQKYVRFVSPLAYYFLHKSFGEDFWRGFRRDVGIGDFISTVITELSPVGYVGWLITLIAVAVVYWHGIKRKPGWLWLISWLVLTSLFNVAGLLTYLSLNHTPAIICPKCQKPRGLLTEDCPRCGKPLPVPRHSDVDLLLLPTMEN